jgi:HlyD family secretion protein
MSRRWLIVAGILLAAVAAWLVRAGRGDSVAVEVGRAETREVFRSYVTASGEVVAEHYADIGSSVMGRVVELPVVEGQEVAPGELLARIDPVQARSELDAAQAAIRALESEAQAARQQVESARAELQLAEARAREATASFERRRALFEQSLISASELDVTRAAAESGDAQVAAARAAVVRAEGSREAADGRVAQARAQAAQARDLLEKTAVVSPIAGVVSRLQVRAGEMVVIGIQNQPGTVLMTVSDLRELNAEVKVAEADVLRVAVGQPAAVTLEALPGRNFAGRITEVGASALPQTSTGAAARDFRVEIRLEDAAPGMRPGLTCDAEILVGEERGVTVVPLQAVVIRLDERGEESRGVFVVDDGLARFAPVETGIIGGLDIAVRGLEPGAEVIVGPYQVLRELDDGARVHARSPG